jgi:hypothetical protein
MTATPDSHGRELLDRLRSLVLPAGDYAVFGSGPLLVRRIVDAVTDLDVICRGEAWFAVKRIATAERTEEGVDLVAIGPISFGTTWAFGDLDVDRLIDGAETIDGLPFVLLEHVVAYKRAAGRPKDLIHLELIDAWMTSG